MMPAGSIPSHTTRAASKRGPRKGNDMRRAAAWLSLLLLVPACVPPAPQRTQLEIREFQTRSYETKDTKMVMKGLLNVLQDDGFIVKNANVDLGLITATKEMDIANKWEAFGAVLAAGENGRWKKNSIIECSGNMSDFGSQTRVRVNFQTKTLNNKGEVMSVGQINEPAFYSTFFAKVDKGIFIQKEKL